MSTVAQRIAEIDTQIVLLNEERAGLVALGEKAPLFIVDEARLMGVPENELMRFVGRYEDSKKVSDEIKTETTTAALVESATFDREYTVGAVDVVDAVDEDVTKRELGNEEEKVSGDELVVEGGI